jgi:hypothetical protein
MAEVFKAKSFGVEGFEKILAIKRILPSMAEDQEFIEMFIDEAKIAGQLSHANICQIFELGRIGDSHFIAMEYVWGKDLLQIQNRFRRQRQTVPAVMAAFCASKICEGLDYAHRRKDAQAKPLGIIHRDVSPQNVLVSYEGEVKMIDFGIAKAVGRSSRTQAGVLKGKFGYMSPEQVRGLPIDRRSDVFAIGTILHELLTGERLFVADSDFATLEKVRNVDIRSPRALNPLVPEVLDRIVMRALAKNPDERYLWANELQEELQAFLMLEEPVFTAKQLAQWMKETFAAELKREQGLLETYKRVGRDGKLPELARPATAERLVSAQAPDAPEVEEPPPRAPIHRLVNLQRSPADAGAAATAAQAASSDVADAVGPPADPTAPVASAPSPAPLFVADLEGEPTHIDGVEPATQASRPVHTARSQRTPRPPGTPGTPRPPGTPGTPRPPSAPKVRPAPAEFEDVPTDIFAELAELSGPSEPDPLLPSQPTVILPGTPTPVVEASARPEQIARLDTARRESPLLERSLPAPRRSAGLGRDIAIGAMVAAAVLLAAAGTRGLLRNREPAPRATLVVAMMVPRDAEVRVLGGGADQHGKLAQGVPAAFKGLAPGPYDVEVTSETMTPFRKHVELRAGDVEVVTASFTEMLSATLRLAVRPEGAGVWVDGVEMTAGGDVIALRVGRHEVRVARPGFVEQRFVLEARAGEPLVREIELRPVQGAIEVASEPAGADVWVAGRLRGATPLVVDELELGRAQRVTLRRSGYAASSRLVTLSAERPRQVLAVRLTAERSEKVVAREREPEERVSGEAAGSLEPAGDKVATKGLASRTMTAVHGGTEPEAPRHGTAASPGEGGEENGFLIANTQPWARVFVDGKDTGKMTPIAPRGRLPLNPGKHLVTFVVEGRSFEYEILVKPGEDTRLIRKLDVPR